MKTDAEAEGGSELAQMAEEQMALRRVATLIAHGAAPADVFTAVTQEAGQVFSADLAELARYEDDAVVALAVWAATDEHRSLVPGPWLLEGGDLASSVSQTGQPVRIETYEGVLGPIAAYLRDDLGVCSSIASPIVVEGHPWGVLLLHAQEIGPPFSPDAESRLADFSELVGAAIANADSRAELAELAHEQAALRRVATLVAQKTPPAQIFAAVTEEVGRLLNVETASMAQYEPPGTLRLVALWGSAVDFVPAGSRWSLGGIDVSTRVFETGRPARIDNLAERSGPVSAVTREMGHNSCVGTPILVEGRLWGLMTVASCVEQPLPTDTEARLASFTELVAVAIADAESRTQLKVSRARIVAAADEARKQIERDLHDGTQQQLVSLMLELRATQSRQPAALGELQANLKRTERALVGVLEELREISRGIHPAILSKAGLGSALRSLARRSTIPVELHLRAYRRPPEHVEVAAYYVVCEALANAAKYSEASVVNIELVTQPSMLQLSVRDDGVGGADPSQGTGLIGLADRVEALGGRLEIASPAGEGTLVSFQIPLEIRSGPALPKTSGRLPSLAPWRVGTSDRATNSVEVIGGQAAHADTAPDHLSTETSPFLRLAMAPRGTMPLHPSSSTEL
jgi:signal transduction histidine kinase